MALPQNTVKRCCCTTGKAWDIARQVAYALNTSEGAVYTRLSRACAWLEAHPGRRSIVE